MRFTHTTPVIVQTMLRINIELFPTLCQQVNPTVNESVPAQLHLVVMHYVVFGSLGLLKIDSRNATRHQSPCRLLQSPGRHQTNATTAAPGICYNVAHTALLRYEQSNRQKSFQEASSIKMGSASSLISALGNKGPELLGWCVGLWLPDGIVCLIPEQHRMSVHRPSIIMSILVRNGCWSPRMIKSKISDVYGRPRMNWVCNFTANRKRLLLQRLSPSLQFWSSVNQVIK